MPARVQIFYIRYSKLPYQMKCRSSIGQAKKIRHGCQKLLVYVCIVIHSVHSTEILSILPQSRSISHNLVHSNTILSILSQSSSISHNLVHSQQSGSISDPTIWFNLRQSCLISDNLVQSPTILSNL